MINTDRWDLASFCLSISHGSALCFKISYTFMLRMLSIINDEKFVVMRINIIINIIRLCGIYYVCLRFFLLH